MMTRLLQRGNFPESLTGFESALVGWEGLMDKWDTASGYQMDEPVEIAVLMSRALTAIKSFLQSQSMTTYTRLREVWEGF